jgi:hypothetical protein
LIYIAEGQEEKTSIVERARLARLWGLFEHARLVRWLGGARRLHGRSAA